MFSPEAGGFWIGDVLSGIDDACAQKNAQMVVVQTAVGWQASIFERVPFGDLLRIGQSLRVGSVAVTATMNPDELATLARVHGPIVTVAGLNPRAGGPAILIDNAGGAIEAVRHLIQHGPPVVETGPGAETAGAVDEALHDLSILAGEMT
jgi:DNA-binding LacI/PurR family transcriptional regulator